MTRPDGAALTIALVSARYASFVGGLEKHIGRLAREIVRAGHQVDVLTQHTHGEESPALETIDGATVRRFPIRIGHGAYPFAPGLWRYLRGHARDYDIVNVFSYHATPAIGAALAEPVNLVFTPVYHGGGHTLIARLVHPAYRVVGRQIFRRSRCVVCGTEAEADLIRSHFPNAARTIVVVPPGIDADEIEAAEPYLVPQRALLCASRLERYKNVELVVRALPFLQSDVVLWVIGDGPDRSRLTELVSDMGLEGRVHFLGRVDDEALNRWLRTAEVLVSMSERESFGMTLLEGAAAGAAVVASDIAPHRELVDRYGHAGISLLPLDSSAESLAEVLRSALTSPRHGRPERVPTWQQHAACVLRCYSNLVRAQGQNGVA